MRSPDMDKSAAQLDQDYPEILVGLVEHLTKLLTDRGIDGAAAATAARECAEHMRQQWGGQLVYIAKGRRIGLSVRDKEIWRKWRGNNEQELCREYDITLARLYQILKAMREEDVEKRQHKLFDG